MMIKSVTKAALLLLLTGKDRAQAFSPRSMALKRAISKPSAASPLFLWVNDFSENGPPSSLEFRVQDCLRSFQSPHVPSIEAIRALLQELETVQNDCTEEGNQTKDECDITRKEKRDAWIEALEDYMVAFAAVMDASAGGADDNDRDDGGRDDASIAPIAASAILPSAASSSASSSESLEAQVRACLETSSVRATVTTTTSRPLTLVHVLHMQRSLENLQNECTEEGNQTEDECDVVRVGERQSLLIELDEMLETPTLDLVQATLDQLDAPDGGGGTSEVSPNDWLSHFARWFQVLEEQTNLCTEEGHQTSDMCRVDTADRRSSLLLRLEGRIDGFQAQATRSCCCSEYRLCDAEALERTYDSLEELESLCTEEGNQTRSFCSLESKEERLALMGRIAHQLELAGGIKSEERDFSFQI